MPTVSRGGRSGQWMAYAFPDDDLKIIDFSEATASMLVMTVDFIYLVSIAYAYVSAAIAYGAKRRKKDGEGEEDGEDGGGGEGGEDGEDGEDGEGEFKSENVAQKIVKVDMRNVGAKMGVGKVGDGGSWGSAQSSRFGAVAPGSFPKLTRRMNV